MENKALYILAGYDDKTEEHLAGIQNRLYDQGFVGVHTKDLPQHITMGSFPVEMEEELKAKVKDTALSVQPIDVTFNHVGIFQGGKVLFIAPDQSREMLDLKEKFGSSYNWTAHTTMLIDETEVLYKALPSVLDNFSAFEGKISYLHLYEFFPARHILTVKLGDDNDNKKI